MMKKNGEDASELLAQAAAIPGELKALEDELGGNPCGAFTIWMLRVPTHHADRQG